MKGYPHIRLDPAAKCAFDGCRRVATDIAIGRYDDGHPTVAVYCRKHAEIVADEGAPEYWDTCPNCGCLHGVN